MNNIRKQIVGSWRLTSFELENLTVGKSMYPYGESPEGLLIFGDDGLMSVSIMSVDRPDFTFESLHMASPDEKINAVDTYLSYAGRWRIADDKIYVEVITSLLPNWREKEHFRTFELDGDSLSFRTPVMRQGEFEIVAVLRWSRWSH